MNLYDIVKRKDRCLQILEGDVEPVLRGGVSGYLGVRLSPGARVRLRDAHQFNCLATFPRDFGWRVIESETNAFEISVIGTWSRIAAPTDQTADIVYPTKGGDGYGSGIVIAWPVWTGRCDGFDIELCNRGSVPAVLASSALFNPRLALAHLLVGNGVEVGPGLNPFVKPTGGVEITYVETLPIDEWRRTYHPTEQTPALSEEILARYVIGDAQQLDCSPDNSLDFVFSSHVFEHLMNPLGVLENWSRKLLSRGVVVGVVPDLRYCFDLRQVASTRDDWLDEYTRGIWSFTDATYEKWCRHTAPSSTPDDFKRRKYSIHAHYYTPQTWRGLAEIAVDRGLFSKIFLNTSPNNKDFGFVLWK